MSSSIHTEQLDLPLTSPSVGTVPTDSPPPLSPLSPLSPMSVCSGSALPDPQHSSPTQSQHSTIEDKIDEELRARANLITSIDLSGVPEWASKIYSVLSRGSQRASMKCVLADWVWLESHFCAVSLSYLIINYIDTK